MNERSSRSHSIFRVELTGENRQTGDSCISMLSLVDLAGSERLSSVAPLAGAGPLMSSDFGHGCDTQKQEAARRLRETQNINKSLAALNNVMTALQRKSDHVPYRDAKLTRVLQTALGGNSKSIMIVNVSPRPSSVGESVCSLRFASKVNAVELGKATRQSGGASASSAAKEKRSASPRSGLPKRSQSGLPRSSRG